MPSFAQAAPLSDTPPVPTFAAWENDIAGIEVTFDKDLQDVPLSAANWLMVFAGRRRRLLDPNVFGGNKIGSPTSPVGLPQFGNSLRYAATPPDVVGVNNIPVEAFDGFPINQV